MGDVTLGADTSVWYAAVLRGDMAPITIGAETNLQDGTIVHVDEGVPCTIGRRVGVGHRVILHGCTVEDECLIGMGSILLNGVRIGTGSVVAAGAVIPGGNAGPTALAGDGGAGTDRADGGRHAHPTHRVHLGALRRAGPSAPGGAVSGSEDGDDGEDGEVMHRGIRRQPTPSSAPIRHRRLAPKRSSRAPRGILLETGQAGPHPPPSSSLTAYALPQSLTPYPLPLTP